MSWYAFNAWNASSILIFVIGSIALSLFLLLVAANSGALPSFQRQAKKRGVLTEECAICGKTEDLVVCGDCKNIAYCGRQHQAEHWTAEHRYYCRFIPGTSVPRDTPMKADPLVQSRSYPRRRTGRTVDDPLEGILHCKRNTDGSPRVRMIKPGKLTPYRGTSRNPPIDSSPYRESGNKQVELPNGKYRHIASFSVRELRKLGWDGAMYNSQTAQNEWVPFVPGYDSDPEYEYEDIDIKAASTAGVVGLPPGEEGIFMEVPSQGVGRVWGKGKRKRWW